MTVATLSVAHAAGALPLSQWTVDGVVREALLYVPPQAKNGREFYTPSSIVRLLTEVIEPYHGHSRTWPDHGIAC
jgi:hypothetical protein